MLAWLVYSRHRLKAIEPKVLAEGWYYDQAVSDFVGGPGTVAFDATADFDQTVIDGAVNGVGTAVVASAEGASKAQTGNMRQYAGLIGLGATLLLAWFVIFRGIL